MLTRWGLPQTPQELQTYFELLSAFANENGLPLPPQFDQIQQELLQQVNSIVASLGSDNVPTTDVWPATMLMLNRFIYMPTLNAPNSELIASCLLPRPNPQNGTQPPTWAEAILTTPPSYFQLLLGTPSVAQNIPTLVPVGPEDKIFFIDTLLKIPKTQDHEAWDSHLVQNLAILWALSPMLYTWVVQNDKHIGFISLLKQLLPRVQFLDEDSEIIITLPQRAAAHDAPMALGKLLWNYANAIARSTTPVLMFFIGSTKHLQVAARTAQNRYHLYVLAPQVHLFDCSQSPPRLTNSNTSQSGLLIITNRSLSLPQGITPNKSLLPNA